MARSFLSNLNHRRGFGVFQQSLIRTRFLILLSLALTLGATHGNAQVGRLFLSAEALVGCSRIVHVGKIRELERVDYRKPLTSTQKIGKPHRLVFEVSEVVRGDDVKQLELVLSLQSTYALKFLLEQEVELILFGSRGPLDRHAGAEIGIEENGRAVEGDWYQFRLLDLLEFTEEASEALTAQSLNKRNDSCRLFTHDLRVVEGREAILERMRAFAKQQRGVLSAVHLRVPNEFGSIVGNPNAYCMVTLPVCPGTRGALIRLKEDPDLVMGRIESQSEEFERSSMLDSVERALASFPEGVD